jgi:hypothetical protein
MQSVISNICANSSTMWEAASLGRAPSLVGKDVTPFRSALEKGHTPAMSGLFTREEFESLATKLQADKFRDQKAAIYGAGTFGLTLAMILSEAGARVTIFSSKEAPSALSRAIGILEPQGKSVERFFHSSLPVFDELIAVGAPIRKDRVTYFYDSPDKDFVEQLTRMPGANYKIETTTQYGLSSKLSFDGYIMSGSAMRTFYMSILKERGVTFVERDITAIEPVQDHVTFSALGMGRAKIKDEAALDLPGNRGQMMVIEGTDVVELLKGFPELAKAGSIGIPSAAGSVNIALHFHNPAKREGPFLIIGATKQPGNSDSFPRKNDSEFLKKGLKIIWPELLNHLENATNIAPEKLDWSEYVCVRPGGGASPFEVAKHNDCIDIRCAGGMGNSLAPAAALKAVAAAI